MKSLLLFLLLTKTICANEWLDAYHEKISEWNIPSWMVEQIEEDFEPYKERGFTLEDLNHALTYPGWYGFTRYHLVDGILSSESSYNKVDVFQEYLKEAHRLWGLPNAVFVIAHSDGVKDLGDDPSRGPILTWAKDKHAKGVILINDYTTSCHDPNPFLELRLSIPWEQRINQVIWRGTATDAIDFSGVDHYHKNNWKYIPRGHLVFLSLKNPELIDARFTACYCCASAATKKALQDVGAMGNYMSINEQIAYKYQIVLDGNVCTYPGYQWRLFSGSLVFRHQADQIQWFYRGLKSWQHYIPVANNLSDLTKHIQWAKEHDDAAQTIAKQGTLFARQYLTSDMNLKFVYLVILRYASLFNSLRVT